MTMVYAVGSPTTRSMDVVAHTVDLPSDGSAAPDTIDTGSAGLAAERPVSTFGSTAGPTDRPTPTAPIGSAWTMPALLLLLGLSGCGPGPVPSRSPAGAAARDPAGVAVSP